MYFNQAEYDIRCEWGPQGLRELMPASDVLIIVDTISFTTAVDAALSRGGQVYPYRGPSDALPDFALGVGAIAATASRKDPRGFSLAPTSLLRLPAGSAVVLASLNGAALSAAAGDLPTFAGCLRNAQAVAAAAAGLGRRISVIPAGERWPDGSLRPGIEDQLGAGAILHALPGRRSPEAEAAVGAYLYLRDRLETLLLACSSGKEAAELGSPEDIRFAAALNVSPLAPRLMDGAFQNIS